MGGKQLKDSKSRVGFDGVADEVFPARERALKEAEALDHLVARIDVERGAVTLGESFKRNLAAGERTYRELDIERGGGMGWR